MRTVLTCVAGVVGLCVVVSSAMAEQPGVAIAEEPSPGQTIEPVRFVAPEPMSENRVPASRQTAPREPRDLLPIGFAQASDDGVPGASADPIPAEPVPISADDTDYTYTSDNDWVECWDDAEYWRVRGRSGRRLIGSTCTMGQRPAYFPPMHGYYYFHPYHHSHVRKHQMFAQMWGEDPANPYANRLFQMIYEQYQEDVAAQQPPVEP